MDLFLGRDTGADTPITVSTPTLLYCVGPASEGSNEFMTELARQAIDSGACVIYVDGQSGNSTWAKIYSAAEITGRHEEVFARSPLACDLVEVSISKIISEGAILWYGNLSGESSEELRLFFDDLVSAVSQRTGVGKPIIVITTGLPEIPVKWRECFTHAKPANVTWILGDHDAHFVDEIIPSVKIDLREGEVGEGVIAIRTDEGVGVAQITLAYKHIDLAEHLLPANSVIKINSFHFSSCPRP